MLKKYPSIYLLLLVVAGIILADQVRLPSWLFLLSCLVLTLFGVLNLGRQRMKNALLLLGLALFSFAGYHFAITFYDLAPNHIANFVSEEKSYQFFGKVADWPNLKSNRTEIKIELDSLGRDYKVPVKGAIMLRIRDTTTALQRGDRIEFQGRVYPLNFAKNPGQFDYGRFLQLQGMFGIVYKPTVLDIRVNRSRRFGIIGAVDKIRHEIASSFKNNLSPPAAALASGILIGETRDISAEIYNRFRDSGTLHLLAVSGSNVALVLIFLVIVLRPFPISRKKRAVILMICVFLFALLSYGEPSVIRASVMATLVLLATMIERRYDLNQIIATTALIILLVDPTQLFSVGFQLSFVTAWGLIFLVPPVVKKFEAVKHKIWFRWLIFPVLISFVAQICSAPLIAFYFERIPAISVLANLFIIPLISTAVVAVLALLVLDFIWPILALFFGSILDKFMQLVFYFLEIFGEDQTVILKTGDLSLLAIILLYALLLASALTMFNKAIRSSAVVMIVLIVNIGLALSIVSAASNKTKTNQIDIFTIPGGIAATTNWGKKRPDLVITGIHSRDYPIDERILGPALSNLNINVLDRIFVISAEYSAIDDLFRLAHAYDVTEIFVDSRLFKSFTDHSNFISETQRAIAIHSFSNKPAIFSMQGFYPESDKLTVDFGVSKVIFLNNLPDSSNSFIELSKPSAFIYSGILNPNSISLHQILSNQQAELICLKVKQPANLINYNGLVDRIYNLESRGACTLIIPEEADRPFQIKTIQ